MSSAAVEHAARLNDLAVTLDPNKVSPGLLGFIVVCIIGLATWALARNMAKHLRRHEANRQDGLDADESGANAESAVVNARDGEAADKGR
jgi:hypothetical protein